MIYSNPEFLLLFVLVFLSFFFCRSLFARQNLLLGASLVFYSWLSFFDALVFLLVVVVAWSCSALSLRFPRRRGLLLKIGVSALLCHLFCWKYAPWILRDAFPTWSPSLPLGISFITLQGIAYLVDWSRGQTPFLSLRRFLLFKAFFSHSIAGPICRASQLCPQLERLSTPSTADFLPGIALFLCGFAKKLMVADAVAPYVDPVFRNPGVYSRPTLSLAVLAYAIQIWADFSGYTDMGVGTARMLGIRLPTNFRAPYLSRSPSEFWRRWHITLSEWIRDYLYIPLGGNRGGVPRQLGVLMLTMTISGLWHGANWTFLLWGAYHGMLLGAERLLRWGLDRLPESQRPKASAFNQAFLWTITFVALLLGWIVFRCQSVQELSLYVGGLLNGKGSQSLSADILVLPLALSCLLHLPVPEIARRLELGFSSLGFPDFDFVPNTSGVATSTVVTHVLVLGLLAMAFLGVLLLRSSANAIPFIYFHF